MREATGYLRFLSPWEYKLKTALAIWPVTLSFCGMIVRCVVHKSHQRLLFRSPGCSSTVHLCVARAQIFNNLCLKYVEITFYQVARSLTIAFNVVFAFCVWGENTSRNCLIACFVVVFGYVTGVDGELNFSWAGYVLLRRYVVPLFALTRDSTLSRL